MLWSHNHLQILWYLNSNSDLVIIFTEEFKIFQYIESTSNANSRLITNIYLNQHRIENPYQTSTSFEFGFIFQISKYILMKLWKTHSFIKTLEFFWDFCAKPIISKKQIYTGRYGIKPKKLALCTTSSKSRLLIMRYISWTDC